MIKYEKRARQVIDYDTLSWGKIHPMDMDGVLEFRGKKLLMLEYKCLTAPEMAYGQRLTLTHIADNWDKADGDNESLIVVATHSTEADEIVEGGLCKVKEIYYKGEWINYELQGKNVRQVVGNYLKEEIDREAERWKSF